MVKFSDKDKQEMGEFFELGIHKVEIATVIFDKTEDGREFVDFEVVDPETNTKEASARLWFHTAGARKYSFNTIRTIFVHNAAEDKKQKIREKVDAVKDTKELDELCQSLVGKEAWLQVYEDPNRTYRVRDKDGNETGEVKPSINRDITGYEPQPKKISAPTQTQETTSTTSSDTDDEVMADF